MADNYKYSGGLANGLLGLPGGSGSSDSTGASMKNIPPELQAIIAARRKKDNTQTWSREDMIQGIKQGFKGMTDHERDSIASKFDHDAYIKHLDSIGMEIAPKKNKQ